MFAPEARMATLLRIGEFARRTGLSIRTLRFYDQEDLLRPAETDPASGYRLYRQDQIERARWVLELRRLGLPLNEIREALRRGTSERALLFAARDRLQESIRTQSSLLLRVRARLGEVAVDSPDLPIRVRSEPQRWVASVRDRLAVASDVTELFAELHRSIHGPRQGHEGVLWHRCADEGGLAAEAFVEVPRSTPARGRVSLLELPPVDVATVRTADDESAAELGYGALRAWMAREGHTLVGPKRELAVPSEPGCLDICFPFRTALRR